MDEIVSMADFGAKVGVSRQAIDQALARANNPPQPITVIGQVRIYRAADLEDWWKKRAETRWQERRIRAQRRAIQLNVRISMDAIEVLDKRRADGETRSAAGARILRLALLSGG